MSRDEIERMVQEAGGSIHDPSDLLTLSNLERFAALIAAAEREAILQILRDEWFKTQADLEAAIQVREQQ